MNGGIPLVPAVDDIEYSVILPVPAGVISRSIIYIPSVLGLVSIPPAVVFSSSLLGPLSIVVSVFVV